MASRKDLLDTFKTLNNQSIMALTSQKLPHTTLQLTAVNNAEIKTNTWYFGSAKLDKLEPEMKKLHERLLAIGGEDTVLPDVEEDIKNILAYGQLWDNITTKRLRGRPSRCHQNAAELWYNNRNSESFKVTICTGYALSNDGLWRQHSWLMQMKARTNVLIETTEPRIAYYGFAMTYGQSEEFEYNNS